ncbi:MAG: SDR family oxidoreductase [Gammaproteobacteria bacterium]|nr:SDR family oxidoreductase [Gammaproteobacteria bacterium]
MGYLVTGGGGFIGRQLLEQLLQRPGTIYLLCAHDTDEQRLQPLAQRWPQRLVLLRGDITLTDCGLDVALLLQLRGTIDHLFHLAAIYDLNADGDLCQRVNVEGTRNVLALARNLQVGCFHHLSSIAVAGHYPGWFRESMLSEATDLDHPYLRSKHEAELLVRNEQQLRWRIYRPGMVIGDSHTGAADRADGPYYFFKMLQKIRNALPRWMPTLGIEGGRLNIVPVDFVARALDHIAHRAEGDRLCYHLTDPHPFTAGEVINIFADAGHAPKMALRLDTRLLALVPAQLRQLLTSLPPVQRALHALLGDLGIPADALRFVNLPTQFDCSNTLTALEGSGIECPRLHHYAPAIWDYWERHLDPDLFIDRSLRGLLADKVVLITGATSGIGEATALLLATAGVRLVLVARTHDELLRMQAAVAERGGEADIHACDLSNLDAVALLVEQVLERHGCIDLLINNAGRSIRRSVEQSFDRFHDYQRTMQLNYFGALKLTLGLLPAMLAKGSGQVINISSIGVLTNAPRFSAYVASKAALEAFTRCAAAEFSDRNIKFTTINMPLVETPMIAPTQQLYRSVPTLKPEEAAALVARAIIDQPKRIATRLGIFGAIIHALFPRLGEIIMNSGFRMFPDSAGNGDAPHGQQPPSAEMQAFAALLRGIHL